MAAIITDEAYNDLANISDFIAQDSPNNAEKFINEIFDAIDNIEENPLIYWKSIYYEDEKHRDMIFKKYTIVFQIVKSEINILAVFKARNYQRKN